jgi:hypothetical protein
LFARSRRVRGILVVGCVLLVAALLLAALPNSRDTLASLFGRATPPSATQGVKAEAYYFVNGVPWGTLLVDGHPNTTTPLVLQPGRYTISYNAAPFRPLRCVLSLPKVDADTCRITSVSLPSMTDQGTPEDGYASAIDLRADLSGLPSDQFQALQTAIEAAVTTTLPPATVQPGDHYEGADGSAQIATRALIATISYYPDTAAGLVNGVYQGTLCRIMLCQSANERYDPQQDWGVETPVAAHWQFTTPDGQVIAAPPASNPNSGAYDQGAWEGATVQWNNGWQVSDTIADPTSQQAYNASCNLAASATYAISRAQQPTASNPEVMEVDADTPASGCLIAWAPAPALGVYPKWSYLLYRFGVLLAANDQAHYNFPLLPVATKGERALAQQWAARQGLA